MDKFPEAYERFEKMMHPEDVRSFQQLLMMYGEWADPRKWIPTSRQIEALRRETLKHGLPIGYVRRERRFSSEYESFNLWMARTTRTSGYQQRVISYMSSHPHATLREARGHRKR